MRLGPVKALLVSAAATGAACLDAHPAAAHTGEPLAPHDLWAAWEFTPPIVLMLLALSLLYCSAVSNLWRSAGAGRLIAPWRVGAYLAGVAILAVALVSPIDAAGSVLFSAHMVQHVLLMMVAAPLLALGAPAYTWLWIMPVGLRRTLARWWIGRRFLRRTVHLLGLPIVIWLVSTSALWLWHMPQLYEAALSHDLVHALEHGSFLWTAWLFWGVAFELCSRSKMGDGLAILLLFTAAMQSGILGALITFARVPWYASYQGTTAAWGLTALEDQQLAGVIMWVPAGTVYLAATLTILGRRLASLDRQAASPVPAPRALPPLLVLLLFGVSAWISGCTPSALGMTLGMNEVSLVPGGVPQQGATALRAYGCGSCHNIPGIVGAHSAVGPPLDRWAERHYIAGSLLNTPGNLIRWIRDPQAIEPGTAMPNLGVTAEDARHISAYLYTLQR